MTATVRQQVLAPFSAKWPQPTGNEVRTLLQMADLTGSKAAALVGVNPRTIRKWVGEEQRIPYASWALLAQAAGFGEIWKS